jgi:Tol biopolymer transport system component
VEKLESGNWSKAKHLDYPCTPNLHDFYYVSSRNNSIYFSIFDNGKGDLYYIPNNSDNKDPIHLDYPINTEHNEHDPFIAPDGSYLIFTSDRPGGFGSADLYICFKNGESSWSSPVNMGETINSEKYDYCPILSPDEKYLFFSSYRTGNGDVYWVDAKIIDTLKE